MLLAQLLRQGGQAGSVAIAGRSLLSLNALKASPSFDGLAISGHQQRQDEQSSFPNEFNMSQTRGFAVQRCEEDREIGYKQPGNQASHMTSEVLQRTGSLAASMAACGFAPRSALNFASPLSLTSNSLRSSFPSSLPMSLLPSVTSPRAARSAMGLSLMPVSQSMQRMSAFSSPHMMQQSNSRGYYTHAELMGETFLMTTDIMFWSGMIGAVVFRRNLIVMLLCTEIVMLACNLNFLFAASYLNDMTGVIMSITITTIAASETAIGLALCVTYYHIRSATDVEALNLLK